MIRRFLLLVAALFLFPVAGLAAAPSPTPTPNMADYETTAAPPRGWQTNPHGSVGYFSLKNAPFPHSSREKGYTDSKGRKYSAAWHYQDSTVGFIVPKDYKPGDLVDIIVYHHGHMNYVERVINTYRLPQMVAEAKKNVIMVVPQGPKVVPDSTCGKLEEPDGLKYFLEEAVALLVAEGKAPAGARIGNVVVTGHSGAYRVLGYEVRQGGLEANIREVWLWDAAYANWEDFSSWIARGSQPVSEIQAVLDRAVQDPTGRKATEPIPPPRIAPAVKSAGNRRFFSIFTEHLANENAIIMAQMTALGIPIECWLDADASKALEKTTGAQFVHTTHLSHSEVVAKLDYFREILKHSSSFAPVGTARTADTDKR